MGHTIGGCERHVVLVGPEIHWNTGNIGRTCLGAGAVLHLIKPLGFSLGSREVKRAGLDYWPKVDLHVWDNLDAFMEAMSPSPVEIALFTKLGKRSYRELPDLPRLFLIFGSETGGLPTYLINTYPESTYSIPIKREIRSLNLSTTVGIALYESMRTLEKNHYLE